MLKESDILYEKNNCYIILVNGVYEVYRNGCTHAIRIARISQSFGLEKAKMYCTPGLEKG